VWSALFNTKKNRKDIECIWVRERDKLICVVTVFT